MTPFPMRSLLDLRSCGKISQRSFPITLSCLTSFDDFRCGLIFIFLEVLHEERTKLVDFFFEIGCSMPGFCWIQELARHVAA